MSWQDLAAQSRKTFQGFCKRILGINGTRLLSGLLLGALSVLLSGVILALLAALQFQEEIAASTYKNAHPSLGLIQQNVAALDTYYDRRDQWAKQQEAVAEQKEELMAVEDQAYMDLTRRFGDIAAKIQFRTHALPSALMTIPFPPRDGSEEDRLYHLPQLLTDYQNAVLAKASQEDQARPQAETQQSLVPRARKVLGDMDAAIARDLPGYQTAAQASMSYRLQQARLDRQAKLIDAQFAASDATFINSTPLADTGMRNLCEALRSYKALVSYYPYLAIYMPKSSLVLALAVVMGLLGSLMQVSRDFVLDKEVINPFEILFRASLGGVVAVALYVFSAAGMVALGQQGTTGENGANLSPYLIAFLGITAGYLSDHITRWISQTGRNTFKLDQEPARWAPRLAVQLNEQKLTLARMAQLLNVDAAVADKWQKTEEPVPPQDQPLIAAYLRLHPSKIFIDIKPEGAEPVPAPAA